jgi:hypothetical protein
MLRTLIAVGLAALLAVPATASTAPRTPQLHVQGNQLVDAQGNVVVIHGVNRSGAEWMCHNTYLWGDGIFDGPTDAASIRAIKRWNINAVRIPLNEDCWLGLPGANPRSSGPRYQRAIKRYVNLLHSQGLIAVLDLHWTDGVAATPGVQCTNVTAACQKPMPDAAHAPQFWRSVATAFKGDLSTVFDLFNEPFPAGLPPYLPGVAANPAWDCWQSGGSACSGLGFQAAGMQTLVDAVRSTGARNIVMLGGLAWSNDLSGWLLHKPQDPTGNLVASWHSYSFNACNTQACWDTQILPVALVVPLVTTEIGEDDCAHGYIDTLMDWLDGHAISYAAWTWNAWDCKKGPALIIDYSGTPTPFGAGYRSHLAQLH